MLTIGRGLGSIPNTLRKNPRLKVCTIAKHTRTGLPPRKRRKNASTSYDEKLNADPAYRRAQHEIMELQRYEPQLCPEFFVLVPDRIQLWFYRDLVLRLES